MNDPYKTLGVSPNASDADIKEAYRKLARKYHPDNYASDNPLADLATEKMKEINEAYDTIQRMRKDGNGTTNNDYTHRSRNSYDYTSGRNSDSTSPFYRVRTLLNSGNFTEAEKVLSELPESMHTAEYHFLQSVVLLRRGWTSDAMKELETACSMDPNNLEYQQAKQMFNGRSDAFGRTYYGNNTSRAECDSCDICSSLLCLNCLCGGFGPRC